MLVQLTHHKLWLYAETTNMTVIVKDPDLALTPLVRFSPQFYNDDITKPNLVLKQGIENLVRVFCDELQELENAIVDVMYELDLDNVSGSSLDVIGKLVGAPDRQSMTDAELRTEIDLQIAVNTSKGTIDDVVKAIKRITRSTIVEWTEVFPASIDFTVNGSTASQKVLDQIGRVLSAGVGFNISYRDEIVGVFNFGDIVGLTLDNYPDEYVWRAYSDIYSCDVTNGSVNVTIPVGNNTLGAVGDIIYFNGDLDTPYEIDSIGGTTLVLTVAYAGSTETGAQLYIQRNKYDFVGEISATNGSTAVTVTTVNKIQNGDTLFIDGSGTPYPVATAAGVNITLTTNYLGSTASGLDGYVVQHSGALSDVLTFV